MEFESKLKKKVLHGQTREVVANVIRFMQKEAEAKKPIKELSKVQERVSLATGINLRSVQNICSEIEIAGRNDTPSFSTPNKKRKRTKPKTNLDDFDKGLLRRIIVNFHVTDKKVPTLRQIHTKFTKDCGYSGSHESLRKIIHEIGFRWRKTKTNRKLLIEKPQIQDLRLQYLRSMRQYRAENRPIIYMDETYIHSSHTHTKTWSDDSNEGLCKPISKGQRLIIVHAGSEEGFIPNAYLKFKSKSKTGDYHDDMKFTNYKKWLQEKLIPNLPANSVIVIDNAPYHNVQTDKCPTMCWKKELMKEWLRTKGISFSDEMLKIELYNLIKLNKPRYKTYVIDKILSDNGHTVLRLPPYHPDLNPIELVWASLKQYVAERNVNFNFKYVETFCDEFFESFSPDEWKLRCQHAKEMEYFYGANQQVLDTVVDDFIINLQSDEDDTDNENSELSGVEELQ